MPLTEKSGKGRRASQLGWAVGLALALVAGATLAVLWPRSRHAGTPSAAPGPDLQEQQLRRAVLTAPADPALRLALIRYLLSVRESSDAVDAAREAAARFPVDAPIQAALADALSAADRMPEAIEALRRLAQTDATYRIDLASALLREGRRAEAARLLQDLPHLKSADAVRAGKVYLDLFRPETAAALFRTAASDPSQPDVAAYLGLALCLSGQYAQAVKPLSSVVGDGASPITHYYLGSALRLSGDPGRLRIAAAELRQASEAAPEEGLFHYELALARVRLGDWEGARSALAEAASRAPDLPEAYRDLASVQTRLGKPVEAAISCARYLRLLGDSQAAVQLLIPMQQGQPGDVALGLALAEADYEAERYPDTRALLERLRARSPSDARVLWDLVNAETALQHYDRALDALDALAGAAPEDAQVQRRRADTLQRLQRYPEAERELTALRDREPDRAARSYDLGMFLRLSSTRPDRLTAAEASLRRALELEPVHAGARYQLGALLEETRRHAEAALYLRRALDRNPSLTDAYRLLGRCYTAQGDRARATEMFNLHQRLTTREAEEKELALPHGAAPATPEARSRLADYYVAHGRLRDAIRELEAVEHAVPSSREAHRRLAQLYGNTYRFERQNEERKLLGQ